MKISREIKTGIVALLVIVLFIWGYNFLKDRSFTDKKRTFYAMYDNVQGLVPSSPITINGLKVGKVADITFHPTQKGILVVHLELSNDLSFSTNTVAEIYSPDFISGKSLRLNLLEGQEMAKSGDTLTGTISSDILGMINEQIAPLQSKVESFIVNADTVMSNINQILNARNQENISRSLDHLNKTLYEFKGISARTDQILVNNSSKIDSILSNADGAMKDFASITDSLQGVNISDTMRKLETTINQFNAMLDSINQGQGSIGKLVHDDGIYNNLEAASKELEELLRDLKEHPKRYVHFSVFGKKETPYKESEPKD